MNTRLTLVLLVLTAAAVGSWYVSRRHLPEDTDAAIDAASYRGYYLKAARILGTGPDGALLYEINAVRAEQQSDNRIEFSDVRIEYSPQSQIPWTIDADTATLFPQQQRVHLKGHVVAVSKEGFSGDETEIRTQYLELDPENYIAETDARVQIRIGSRSITGTGMLASLSQNTMEIRSNVSGRFIP